MKILDLREVRPSWWAAAVYRHRRNRLEYSLSRINREMEYIRRNVQTTPKD